MLLLKELLKEFHVLSALVTTHRLGAGADCLERGSERSRVYRNIFFREIILIYKRSGVNRRFSNSYFSPIFEVFWSKGCLLQRTCMDKY